MRTNTMLVAAALFVAFGIAVTQVSAALITSGSEWYEGYGRMNDDEMHSFGISGLPNTYANKTSPTGTGWVQLEAPAVDEWFPTAAGHFTFDGVIAYDWNYSLDMHMFRAGGSMIYSRLQLVVEDEDGTIEYQPWDAAEPITYRELVRVNKNIYDGTTSTIEFTSTFTENGKELSVLFYNYDGTSNRVLCLDGWELTATPLPEPASMGMLLVGTLVMTRRRRRQTKKELLTP